MAALSLARECCCMSATNPEKVRDWPLWWFAQLELAVERGDHQEAALAQKALEKLGVSVQYRGRRPVLPHTSEGASHAE